MTETKTMTITIEPRHESLATEIADAIRAGAEQRGMDLNACAAGMLASLSKMTETGAGRLAVQMVGQDRIRQYWSEAQGVDPLSEAVRGDLWGIPVDVIRVAVDRLGLEG